jgi:transcriptional regulator with XRE-family HTH domain
MHARFTGMTLQTVLRQHGITTIKDLMHRTGLSRQYAWNLWHGYDGVGKETMRRLHTSLGIPLEALLQVDPVPAAKRPRTTPKAAPRGRPRKRSSSATPPPKEDDA